MPVNITLTVCQVLTQQLLHFIKELCVVTSNQVVIEDPLVISQTYSPCELTTGRFN